MVRVKLEGFDAFETQLRGFPAALAEAAGVIVHEAAEGAMRAIGAAYPIRTDRPRRKTQTHEAKTPGPRFKVRNQSRRPQTPPGALRAGMTVQQKDRALHPKSVVRNTNPLSNIFENGTQARHTALGAFRGSMPPGHVFVPRAMSARRTMNAALVAMCRQNDLVVTEA